MRPKRIYLLFFTLLKQSKLKSNAVPVETIGTYGYYSFPFICSSSIGKTIYTIDLLRLMRFYHSPDTTYIRSKVSGNFGELEQKIIVRNKIDTSILYR
jgi:hypothetical protein